MLKRWIVAAAIAVALMIADVLALIGVTRAFLPAKPPMWATAPFFWVLAWPVQLLTSIFPQPAASTDKGPTFIAVAIAAIIDFVLITLLVDFIRRRRQARAAATAR